MRCELCTECRQLKNISKFFSGLLVYSTRSKVCILVTLIFGENKMQTFDVILYVVVYAYEVPIYLYLYVV